MLRIVLTIAVASAGLAGMAGCEGGRTATATKPQAPNQRPKTTEERIDYLIAMLHRKQSPDKNLMAARELGEAGVDAVKAIPDLEQVMTDHADPKVRDMAQRAIAQIQAAQVIAQ